METSLMRHSKAIAASTANSTAFLFNTGNAPGSPRQTGHTFVFGGSPKRVEHEQKIFEAVSSCTWTSSPMTGSYFARRSSEGAGVVAIEEDYSWTLRLRSGQAREGARRSIERIVMVSWLPARLGTFPSGFRNTSVHCPSRPGLPSRRSWRRRADWRCRRYRKTENHVQWSAVPPPWRQTEPARVHPTSCGSRRL